MMPPHTLLAAQYTTQALQALGCEGEDDKITFAARVIIVGGTDYRTWGRGCNYDCKSATGMVGLLNQGESRCRVVPRPPCYPPLTVIHKGDSSGWGGRDFLPSQSQPMPKPPPT